ncbi:MAG: adenylyltransferase/cytidyltransferase family protein [Ectobacillus sp.]
MKIVHLYQQNEGWGGEPCVMALGYFDGVHLGHQEVIQKAKQIAKTKQQKCAVMTFDPHPKEVIRKQKVHYLMPLMDKARKLQDLGVDILYVVHFSLQVAAVPPEDFVENYLVRLNVSHVVAGFDFTYGAKGKGSMSTLKKHARGRFGVTTVLPVTECGEKISSTRIRNTLKAGCVEEMPDLLGHYYEVKGEIIEREGFFPNEASAAVYGRYTLPHAGVYEVSIYIEGKKYSAWCTVHPFMEHAVSLFVSKCYELHEGSAVAIQFLRQAYVHAEAAM